MDETLQYWLILKRRWLPASIVFVALLALSTVRALQEVPIYQATGQLLFKKNTASSLTGIGGQLGQLETFVTGGNPLENEAAVLRSLPLAERTIASLNLSVNPQIFLKNLSVKNITGTDILELSYADIDPNKSASVVNTLMNIYIENEITANRAQTKSARDFIEQQLRLRKSSLQKAEETLQQFKLQNKVLDLRTEAVSTVEFLVEMEKQLAATRSELEVQNARLASVRGLFGVSSQEAAIASFVGESPTIIPVLEQLQQIQQKIEIERLRLTDINPAVINLREQEAVLKKQLQQRIEQSFIGKAGRLNQNINPDTVVQLRPQGIQQSALSNYAAAEAERLTLQVRLKSLTWVIDNYRKRAGSIPGLERQQRQLEREIGSSESSYKNLLDRYQELQVAENQQVSNARVITPALVPGQPIKSRQYMKMLQGLIGGFLLAGATAMLLEKIDKTVKTPQSAKDLLGYPLLGNIPLFTNRSLIASAPEVMVRDNPDSAISEAFRMLQTNLRFFNADRPIKVIVVASSVPKEGKSTIAANLAVTMSQIGRRVLLVDGDLRHPTQHQIWNIPNQLGLCSVLIGQSNLEQTVVGVMPNLQVLTAGVPTVNPVALLDATQMAILVAKMAQNYDFAIIDAPPLIVAADATILGKMANGILLVVRPGVVDSTHLIASKELLDQTGQNVLGLAINGVEISQYSHYNVSGVRSQT